MRGQSHAARAEGLAAPADVIKKGDQSVLTLDDWLWSSEISPADFGRTLGLKWPYSVRRYLRRDVHRRPRKDWRAPRHDIQLKIEKLTWGLVTPADWNKEVARHAETSTQAGSGSRSGSPSPARGPSEK